MGAFLSTVAGAAVGAGLTLGVQALVRPSPVDDTIVDPISLLPLISPSLLRPAEYLPEFDSSLSLRRISPSGILRSAVEYFSVWESSACR